MTIHELKCWREPFQAVVDGTKRHEVRRADRDFKVGDVIELREWLFDVAVNGVDHPGKFSGRSAQTRITHITAAGTWGLPADVCVLSIQLLNVLTIERTAAAPAPTAHRLKLARERAGLSLGQAAKILKVERGYLEHLEALPSVAACSYLEQLAENYGVNVPWLLGEVPQHDCEAMKDARGYDKLTQHDKDVVAEFAASLPKNGGTFADRVHRLKGPGRR